MVATEALEHPGNDGDATGYGCVMDEVDVVLGGKPGEACSAIGDELFVGSDDGFAGGDGLAEPGLDGVEAAHKLDDDIDVGGEDGVDVLGPDGVFGDELCGG